MSEAKSVRIKTTGDGAVAQRCREVYGIIASLTPDGGCSSKDITDLSSHEKSLVSPLISYLILARNAPCIAERPDGSRSWNNIRAIHPLPDVLEHEYTTLERQSCVEAQIAKLANSMDKMTMIKCARLLLEKSREKDAK